MAANHRQLGCQHILGVSPPLHFSLHSHAYELCEMQQAAMLGVLGAPSHLPLHAISHAVWLSITFFSIFYRALFPSGSNNTRVSRIQPRRRPWRGDLCYLFTDAHCCCSPALHKVKRLSGRFCIRHLLCPSFGCLLAFLGRLSQGLRSTGCMGC